MTSETPTSPRQPAQQAKDASKVLDNLVEENSYSSQSVPFDVIAAYRRNLMDDDAPMPIAAVLALTELLTVSKGKITRTYHIFEFLSFFLVFSGDDV